MHHQHARPLFGPEQPACSPAPYHVMHPLDLLSLHMLAACDLYSEPFG